MCVSDSTSREEVRQVYPEPPTDDHSLDIQQQALLRQQQRTINNLRTARPAGQGVRFISHLYMCVD